MACCLCPELLTEQNPETIQKKQEQARRSKIDRDIEEGMHHSL